MTDRPMHAFLIRDRQQGKSTALLEWLRAGEALDDLHPGALMRYDRALLVLTEKRKQEWLRRSRVLLHGRVFSVRDVAHARGIRFDRTEFAIDDAEELIFDSFPAEVACQVRLVTMTGDASPTIVDALQWALDHTREEIEERLAEIRPDPNLLDSLPQG